MATWPGVLSALLSRAAQRSHSQAVHFTSTQLGRLDERLYVLLWHMADRWGHTTRDGVELEMKLTHAQLGRIFGASRPAITKRLGLLHEAGVVVRRDGGAGWVLRGPPL